MRRLTLDPADVVPSEQIPPEAKKAEPDAGEEAIEVRRDLPGNPPFSEVLD